MLTKRETQISHNAAARFAIVCARYNERYTDAMLWRVTLRRDRLGVSDATERVPPSCFL